MSESNGKTIKAITTIAVFLGLVVGFCELKDYIAWAEDVDRLENIIEEKVEAVRVMVAQSYEQMQKDQSRQTLSNLRLQEYQWMLLQIQHPEDSHVKATLERIRADIQTEERKLRGQ
jgi:hypothetical protein